MPSMDPKCGPLWANEIFVTSVSYCAPMILCITQLVWPTSIANVDQDTMFVYMFHPKRKNNCFCVFFKFCLVSEYTKNIKPSNLEKSHTKTIQLTFYNHVCFNNTAHRLLLFFLYLKGISSGPGGTRCCLSVSR